MAHSERALLRRGSGADEFIELVFKQGSWESEGIPEGGCRIRQQRLEALISAGGRFAAEDAIHGLMDWLDVTDDPSPAMATIRSLLDRHFPQEGRTTANCHFIDEKGVDRGLTIGPVDRSGDVVSWQREGLVFAVGQPSEEEPSRLVVELLHPLPLRGALKILALSVLRFMGEPFDSFQGAVSMAGATSNFYAWQSGQLTTCHWPLGLGIREVEGRLTDCSSELLGVSGETALSPNQVAIMIAISADH